jgi:hypothetical protein
MLFVPRKPLILQESLLQDALQHFDSFLNLALSGLKMAIQKGECGGVDLKPHSNAALVLR